MTCTSMLLLAQAVAAQLDKLAAQEDTAQDAMHTSTANEEVAVVDEDANKSAAEADKPDKKKRSEGAALSWPKRTKHKT